MRGYVVLKFEGNAVYLNREDAAHGQYRNAVWLDVAPDSDNGRAIPETGAYATVEGTFDASELGHMGLFAGGLAKIRRLDVDE